MHRATYLDTYPDVGLGITPKAVEEFLARTGRLYFDARMLFLGQLNMLYLVATTKGEIVAYLVASQRFEREIKALYVLPKFQNLGIGQDLMQAALNWLGRGVVRLSVAIYNTGAIRFYDRWSFEVGAAVTDTSRLAAIGERVVPEVWMFKE